MSGMNGKKESKATAADVESYLNINDIKKLVHAAVNKVAAERPADFTGSLAAALKSADLLSTKQPAPTAAEAEAAKKYLASHKAEQVLSQALSRLAVAMPPSAADALADMIAAGSGAAATSAAAPKAAEPKKADKAADGPPKGVDAKAWKAAVKEGGKKGVELAGCADMGGLEFFTTQIEAANGDPVLLQAAMDAANKEVDPAEEEAKGGSAMVGKMLLSSGDKQLALLCYVPKEKKDKVNATEWMKAVLASCSGEFVSGDGFVAVGKSVGDGTSKFPLKDKDTCQAASVEWLKAKGLFPQADDDADDWVPPEDADIEW